MWVSSKKTSGTIRETEIVVQATTVMGDRRNAATAIASDGSDRSAATATATMVAMGKQSKKGSDGEMQGKWVMFSYPGKGGGEKEYAVAEMTKV